MMRYHPELRVLVTISVISWVYAPVALFILVFHVSKMKPGWHQTQCFCVRTLGLHWVGTLEERVNTLSTRSTDNTRPANADIWSRSRS